MTFDVSASLVYFLSLLVISSNHPTGLALDDWVSSAVNTSSELRYMRDSDIFVRREHHGNVYGVYYPDKENQRRDGGHPVRDIPHERKYDVANTQLPHRINQGKPPSSGLFHRSPEEIRSDFLSRRIIDVGAAENRRQSIGSAESRKNRNLDREPCDEINLNRDYLEKKPPYETDRVKKLFKRQSEDEEDLLETSRRENATETSDANQNSEERAVDSPRTIESSDVQGRKVYHGKRTQPGNVGKGSNSRRDSTKNKVPNAPRRNITQTANIVFPETPRRSFVPKVTGCGEGSTFCEKMGDDYPREYIKQVLKKEGDRFRGVFGSDSLPEPNITERLSPDEIDLCVSNHRVIFPTKAKNKDEKWQFVINQEGFTQGIGVETCLNVEKPCSMTDGFPLAYQTSCKQKYITRRLVSLNENGGPGMSEFLFPSCCVCIVHSVGLGTRSKTRS